MSEKVVKGIHYAILTIIAIAFVLPLVWLILASLDTGANATLKLPDSWTLDNFVGVLTDKANLRASRVWQLIHYPDITSDIKVDFYMESFL